jgi:hypothetical protein
MASGTLHSGRLKVKASLEDGAPALRCCLGTRGCRRRVQRWQRRTTRRVGARREWMEKKEELFGDALLRKPHGVVAEGGVVAETVGRNGGRKRRAKPWAWARRQPPLFEGAQHGLGVSVWTVRLTGGPHAVLIFFQFIQNRLNFKNSKWVPYVALKIPNFYIWLT